MSGTTAETVLRARIVSPWSIFNGVGGHSSPASPEPWVVSEKPAAAMVGLRGVLRSRPGMSGHVCMGPFGWMGDFYWARGSVLAWGRLGGSKVIGIMS